MYSEPNFEPVPQVSKERVHEVSFGRYTKPNSPVKTYNSNSQHKMQYSSNFRGGDKHHSGQPQQRSMVNNITAPVGHGNWSDTTVKESTLSGTVRSLARTRSSTSLKLQTLQRNIRTRSGKGLRREFSW